jgi:hypothetical protein
MQASTNSDREIIVALYDDVCYMLQAVNINLLEPNGSFTYRQV